MVALVAGRLAPPSRTASRGFVRDFAIARLALAPRCSWTHPQVEPHRQSLVDARCAACSPRGDLCHHCRERYRTRFCGASGFPVGWRRRGVKNREALGTLSEDQSSERASLTQTRPSPRPQCRLFKEVLHLEISHGEVPCIGACNRGDAILISEFVEPDALPNVGPADPWAKAFRGRVVRDHSTHLASYYCSARWARRKESVCAICLPRSLFWFDWDRGRTPTCRVGGHVHQRRTASGRYVR